MAQAQVAGRISDEGMGAFSKIKEIAGFVAGGSHMEIAKMTPGDKIDLMQKLARTELSLAKLFLCFLLILDPQEIRNSIRDMT
jgi:hypothetical protein